jgi:hypothetical protein
MDTPPAASPSPEGLLSQAAQAAAQQPPAPRLRFVQFPLPDLLAALVAYSQPALQHVAAALKQVADAATAAGQDPKAAARDVSHFAAVREWCIANPDAAARIAICGAYLAEGSAKFLVQQEPPAAAEGVVDEPAPSTEGEQIDPAAAPARAGDAPPVEVPPPAAQPEGDDDGA